MWYARCELRVSVAGVYVIIFVSLDISRLFLQLLLALDLLVVARSHTHTLASLATTPHQRSIITLAFCCAHSWKHSSCAAHRRKKRNARSSLVARRRVIVRLTKKEEMRAALWAHEMTQFTCFARSNIRRFGSVILIFFYFSLRFVLILLSKRISLLFFCFGQINYANAKSIVFYISSLFRCSLSCQCRRRPPATCRSQPPPLSSLFVFGL